MSDDTKLRDIIARQKSIFTELEQEANLIINSDLSTENKALKNEIIELKDSVRVFERKLELLTDEYNEIKNALHEQVYSEKLRIIHTAARKSEIYFKSALENELNNLSRLEYDLRAKMKKLRENINKYGADAADDLKYKLEDLSDQAEAVFKEAKEKAAKETNAFSAYGMDEFEKLKEEQITEEIYEELGRKNNLETFIGGNIINKLGIIFVLIGIIAVSQFTFVRLPNEFKGAIMFLISGAFLCAGEFLNRKKANVFSLGLTATGTGGLYISLSVSYFYLKILDMYPALLLCVLITAGVLVLSLRYASQTIAAFALFGGYIPIVSISDSITLIYGAMVYFVILNLLALIISYYKKWKACMFIGFFLNLSGTIYIITNIYSRRYDISAQAFTIMYVFFAFAIYTIIPLINNLRVKAPFAAADVVVLALNTIISAIITYSVFQMFSLSAYNGAMAVIYTLVYISLAFTIEKFLPHDENTAILFYITGLTFAVLTIPLQFGRVWLSLGWLIEGVTLAAYGIIKDAKGFKRAGYIICALCFASFFIIDIPARDYYYGTTRLFPYKYLAVTLGSIIILMANTFKKSLSEGGESAYKYLTLVNIWFYSLYLVYLSRDFISQSANRYDTNFLVSALGVTVTFLYAYILPRIPKVSDKGTKIISIIISIISMFYLFAITSFFRIIPYADGGYPTDVMFMATFILVMLCLLAVLSLRSVLLFFITDGELSVEWLPFVVSAYFLVILTQNLVAQYRLSFYSIAISLIYVIASLLWIIFGFLKRYSFMRRFGLGLSITASAKLFLIDLSYLTQGVKIITYFAFGAALLGISFMYQYFGKRIIPKKEESDE